MERRAELWMVGGFIGLVVVIAIVAGIFSGSAQQARKSTFLSNTVPAVTSADWVRGNSASPISVIEYGDYQCPACGAYEPMVEQLTQQYGSRVAFVFRNFPLPQHQDAWIAAQAAEAAGLQGKYWEMHDLLYKNQATWSNEPATTVVVKYYNGYAQSIGLNMTKFAADINSQAVKDRIQKDLNIGNAAQIDHTPTFFINLREIQNPQNIQEFHADIDSVLASSTAH